MGRRVKPEGMRRGGLAGTTLASLVAVLLVLTLLPVIASVATSEAAAQQRPRTVLEMLFGNGTRAIEPQRRAVRPKLRQTRPARTRPSRARSEGSRKAASAPAAAKAASEAIVKQESAEKILVVGDFMAQGLASGLSDIYAEKADVVVKDRINGSSGLVREDFYDWTENLAPILEEEKPAVLVMMIGSNDRQPMAGGPSLPFRSEAWTAEYEKRIAEISAIAKAQTVPLVWVGMPSFKSDRMSEDMVFLNDLYRKEMSNVSGAFVDIWDGFVDADDNFAYSGPDVSGQPTRLRNSDGITMTEAGDDKLGFFAEKAIGRLLKTPLGVGSNHAIADEHLANIHLPPIGNAANAVTTAPVSLDDPSLDGADTLLGRSQSLQGFTLETSPRDRLVLNGASTGSVEGRADDFDWNEKKSAVGPDGPAVAFRGTLDLATVRASEGIKPPEEMPGILDAIVQEWSDEENAAKPPSGPERQQPESGTK